MRIEWVSALASLVSQAALFSTMYSLIRGIPVLEEVSIELLILNSVITTVTLSIIYRELLKLGVELVNMHAVILANVASCGLLYTPLAAYTSLRVARLLDSLANECCSATVATPRLVYVELLAPLWLLVQPLVGYLAGLGFNSLDAFKRLAHARLGVEGLATRRVAG